MRMGGIGKGPLCSAVVATGRDSHTACSQGPSPLLSSTREAEQKRTPFPSLPGSEGQSWDTVLTSEAEGKAC